MSTNNSKSTLLICFDFFDDINKKPQDIFGVERTYLLFNIFQTYIKNNDGNRKEFWSRIFKNDNNFLFYNGGLDKKYEKKYKTKWTEINKWCENEFKHLFSDNNKVFIKIYPIKSYLQTKDKCFLSLLLTIKIYSPCGNEYNIDVLFPIAFGKFH